MGFGGSTGAPSRRTGRCGYGSRARAAAVLIDPKPGDSILDYGAGDGRLLKLLRAFEPDARLVGFEPWSYDETYIRLKGTADDLARDIRSIRGEEFDTVVCLILTQHLSDEVVAKIFDDLVAHTRIDGRIIVSVPARMGRRALLSGTMPTVLGPPRRGLLGSLWAAATGRRTSTRRGAAGFASAGGGDHPVLRRWLKRPGLALVETRSWPVPILGSVLNSHTFFVLRRVGGPGRPLAPSQPPRA
jgi:SAM-dependent methyltransferase